MFQDSLTKKIAEAAAQIKTEPEVIKNNEKSVEGAVEKIMSEALKGNQHKIDANKNNKVDAHDFKLLRAQKEKEKANSMKYGKEVKEQVKPEVEKSFPATGVTKHAPIKGVNYMPKDKEKEKANSMKFGKNVKEENELEEATPTAQQVKQGIGIARDKRYAKGNVTGAVKAMDKVNKGIAQHPVVNKELRKQNEEVELTESHFKVGDEVVCKKSGMEGEVVKVDEPQVGKYYTVKQENGKMVKYAPNELKKEEEDEKEDMKESSGASKAKEEKFHMGLDKLVHKTFGHSPAEKKEKMKEDVEQIDELSKSTLGSYVKKASDSATKNAASSTSFAFRSTAAKNLRVKDAAAKISDEGESKKQQRLAGITKAVNRLTKEETIDEAMFPGSKEYEKKYGQSPQQKLKKVGDTEKTAQGEMKKTAKGVMHTRRFTEMLETYKDGGLKTIASMIVKEEPDNEQFTKEVEEQKKRDRGEIRNDKGVAKPFQNASVHEEPVKTEETHNKIQVIDMTDPYNIEKREIDLEEREMTDAEMKKREDIVKGMKKGMQGFKQRYGERAKEVMYATATKSAMKD